MKPVTACLTPQNTDRLMLWIAIGTCLAFSLALAGAPPHPETRTAPSPSETKVSVNPPPLLWPATKGGKVTYQIRLSRDRMFPETATIVSGPLPWAIYNPHRKLEPGLWYWQYGVAARGKKPAWSEVFSFKVDDSARTFVTPIAAAIIKGCPQGHPRILATAEELADLRRRAAGNAELERIIDAADRCQGRNLPAIETAKPRQKGANTYERRTLARVASKDYAGAISRDVSSLAVAFLLTGKEQYARETVRRAMFIAALDPNGDTLAKVSDFADGSCMHAMALAYDSCREFFTPGSFFRFRTGGDGTVEDFSHARFSREAISGDQGLGRPDDPGCRRKRKVDLVVVSQLKTLQPDPSATMNGVVQ